MKLTRRLLVATALIWVALPAPADMPPVFSKGAAIRGYDPVAYFNDSKPVRGSDEFTAEWNGATWHFASAENRDSFVADPNAFAPQYGGYCAWAVSRGYLASTDPQAWEVYEGKLYLNYSRRVHRRWSRDIPGNVAKGNSNWPAVLE